MTLKHITMSLIAAAMVALPSERATAGSGDLAAGIAIGVIGSAIVRNAGKQQRRTTRKTVRRSGISQAQRAENREIQTSLNYFGFPVGAADGSLGRKSRAGITNYQLHMGYPATGQLTQYEKDFLITSYHRSIAGGASTSQLIAQNPQGSRGLLHTYRDQLAGNAVVPQYAPQPTLPAATAVTLVPQQQIAPQPQVLAPQTTTVTAIQPATPATGALPTFMGATQTVSLASHCNQVSLVTSTNGGFTRSDNVVDANFALNEQFCLARTYAIAQGEQLMSGIQGFSPEQIQAQCEGFGPAMKDHVAALSLKPVDAVVQDVSNFVLNSGLSPAQLSGTAKICLSVGYRIDNMDVALGSALLLTVLGEPVYSELMGHHLTQGFGTSRRNDLALPWYEKGLTAIEGGAVEVFAPGQPERNTLIRRAAYMVGDNRQGAANATVKPVSQGLATFQLKP